MTNLFLWKKPSESKLKTMCAFTGNFEAEPFSWISIFCCSKSNYFDLSVRTWWCHLTSDKSGRDALGFIFSVQVSDKVITKLSSAKISYRIKAMIAILSRSFTPVTSRLLLNKARYLTASVVLADIKPSSAFCVL